MSLEQARAFDWRFQTHGDEHLKRLFATVGKYAAALPDSGWLTLVGKPGCGKTHLAKRVRRFWNHHHYAEPIPSRKIDGQTLRTRGAAEMIRWGVFFRELRARPMSMREIGSPSDLLVIDDIGTEPGATEHECEQSRSALVDMMTLREGKATVFTANLAAMKRMEQMDERLISRLHRNGQVFETKATDYRLRTASAAPEAISEGGSIQCAIDDDDDSFRQEFSDPEIAAAVDRLARKMRA